MGFWGGKDTFVICQLLTNHNQLFWYDNPIECNKLIEDRFLSFKTTIEIVLYFIILFRIVYIGLKTCNICYDIYCCGKRQKTEVVFDTNKQIILIPLSHTTFHPN